MFSAAPWPPSLFIDEAAGTRRQARLCSSTRPARGGGSCQGALELEPKTARVEHLLGMALVCLGQFESGMRAHRRAVRRWWRDLCRRERQEAACPGPTPASLDRVRANAAAALHNVGLAHLSRGKRRSSSDGPFSVARVSFLR